MSVRAFVDRVESLAQPEREGGLGKAGAEARALLARRGLTDAVLAQIAPLLRAATTLGPVRDTVAYERAEAELWAYYLEWSRIARTAIKSRAMLRQLGLTTPQTTEAAVDAAARAPAGGDVEEPA